VAARLIDRVIKKAPAGRERKGSKVTRSEQCGKLRKKRPMILWQKEKKGTNLSQWESSLKIEEMTRKKYDSLEVTKLITVGERKRYREKKLKFHPRD